MTTWDEISDRVNDEDGLAVVTLGELRDASDFGKLGRFVLAEIRNRLGQHALGAFPGDLLDHESNPDMNQHQKVRVFRLGTPLADLVKAVESPTPSGDTELRNRAAANETEKLNRIRAIVCEGA